MFVGHLAIGVAIKAGSPRTPTWPILIGVSLMDIFNGLFSMLGINQVTPNLARGPYLFFDLTFIDWDHSLLMALVLAALWAAAMAALFRKDKTTAWLAGLAVFSHFLADWPMHNRDLALYPYAAEHLGYGLWDRLGTASWLLEGLFSAALVAWAWRRMQAIGVSLMWPAALLTVAFLNVSPWLSPLQWVAPLPQPWPQFLFGLLTGGSFVLMSGLLTWLINRAMASAHQPASVPV